jgi:hypothetical protein
MNREDATNEKFQVYCVSWAYDRDLASRNGCWGLSLWMVFKPARYFFLGLNDLSG